MSEVLDTADNNTRLLAQEYADVLTLMSRIHRAYARLNVSIEHDDREERAVPRLLITRTHASIVAAIRLASGGSLYETYPLLRVVIEQAWYALHIATDPAGTLRARVWLCRNDDEEAMRRCKAEFTVGNVRATHENRDPQTARQLQQLYDVMIDYGGHPNQRGLLAGLERTEAAGETTFWVPILSVEELPRMLALRMVVAVAIGAMHVFNVIYPERMQLVGLRAELDVLGEELNRVFRTYVERAKQP